MSGSEILMQRQAIAVQKGLELARELSPLDAPLRLMAEEPIKNDVHVLAEVTAVLAQVCAEQRDYIIELAERIEDLEASAPAKAAAKK
jgi:hypothetical protein